MLALPKLNTSQLIPSQNLRRRLKRLKRGLPPDESPQPGGRSISVSSNVATGTYAVNTSTFSKTSPGWSSRPARCHQSISISTLAPQSGLAMPTKGGLPPPAPSYSSYPNSNGPFPRPYHHSPYSTTPTNVSPTFPTNGSGHSHHPSIDRSHIWANGQATFTSSAADSEYCPKQSVPSHARSEPSPTETNL